jgi:hypothetical protein
LYSSVAEFVLETFGQKNSDVSSTFRNAVKGAMKVKLNNEAANLKRKQLMKQLKEETKAAEPQNNQIVV